MTQGSPLKQQKDLQDQGKHELGCYVSQHLEIEFRLIAARTKYVGSIRGVVFADLNLSKYGRLPLF